MNSVPSADKSSLLPQKAYFWPIEVANYFRVTKRTVNNWINEGRIKAVRLNRQWRIPRSEIVRIEKEGLKPYVEEADE